MNFKNYSSLRPDTQSFIIYIKKQILKNLPQW